MEEYSFQPCGQEDIALQMNQMIFDCFSSQMFSTSIAKLGITNVYTKSIPSRVPVNESQTINRRESKLGARASRVNQKVIFLFHQLVWTVPFQWQNKLLLDQNESPGVLLVKLLRSGILWKLLSIFFNYGSHPKIQVHVVILRNQQHQCCDHWFFFISIEWYGHFISLHLY